MTEADIMAIMRDALMLAMKLAIPMLVISLVLGLVVAVFQAATQIHEQTLTFIPKAVVIAIILLVAGHWMIQMMRDFFIRLIAIISNAGISSL